MPGNRFRNSKDDKTYSNKKQRTKQDNNYNDDFYFGENYSVGNSKDSFNEEEFVYSTKNKQKKSKKKLVFNIILVVFIIAFIVSAYMIISEILRNQKSAETYESIAQLVPQTEDVDDQTDGEELNLVTPREKYQELIDANPDFVGWMQIEDTTLNYPIVQTVNSPDYYLKRNFEKEYDENGTPYVEEACILGYSDNVLIYGHDMLSNAMFGDLDNYYDKSFYDEHKYIKFDTLDEFATYEIVTVFQTVDMPDKGFKYYSYIDLSDEDTFNEFVAGYKAIEEYDTGVDLEFGDDIITLSTCENTITNGRFVVVAKKISSSPTQHLVENIETENNEVAE